MSQRELAEAAGVTPAAVYQWERGTSGITEATLEKVVGALGLTMKRFYGRVPKAKAA